MFNYQLVKCYYLIKKINLSCIINAIYTCNFGISGYFDYICK